MKNKSLSLYLVLISALFLFAVTYGAVFGFPLHVPIHLAAGFYMLVIAVGVVATRGRRPNG